MDGGLVGNPRYEHLRKDAERNLEVGRFLSAAREFQVLSLMAEKDGAFELAGDFAAKSGDCWLKSGRHAAAAIMYEQAANYFHISGKTSPEKNYLRKAFMEFLLASRTPQTSLLDKASFLFRAAKCSLSLGDQDTAKRLLLKACDLSLSFAASSFSNNEYGFAVTHHLFAIKCCAELGDKEKELQLHSLVCESFIHLIKSLIVTPSREQIASIQPLLKEWFSMLTANNALKEHREQASELVSKLLSVALELKNPDIIRTVLDVLSESDPALVADTLRKPSITASLTSFVSTLSAEDNEFFPLLSLLQLLFKDVSGGSLINCLPEATLHHLRKLLSKNILLSQVPDELKSKLAAFSSNKLNDFEGDD